MVITVAENTKTTTVSPGLIVMLTGREVVPAAPCADPWWLNAIAMLSPYSSSLAATVGAVPPETPVLLNLKKRPRVGSTVICDPDAVTTPPDTVATVAMFAYSASMSNTACCSAITAAVGNDGNVATAVNAWFKLALTLLYGIAAGIDAPLASVSPVSTCGIETCPLSAVLAATVEEVMAYVTVHTPALVVVTVRIVPLVTLKFPLPFAVPTTVIFAPTTGMFPEVIWKVNVPVVVTAESEMTKPSVGPVLSLYDPNRYSGVPATKSLGIALNGVV